jgi:hypothetical protein
VDSALLRATEHRLAHAAGVKNQTRCGLKI